MSSSRRTVIVTGASSGIGKATAERLVELDFRVIGTVRDDEAASRLAALGATPVRLDLADSESIEVFGTSVELELGEDRVVGLVNNAGTAIAGPLELLTAEALHEQAPGGCRRPDPDDGSAPRSTSGQSRPPGLRRVRRWSLRDSVLWPYSMAKAALAIVADTYRVELAPARIQVALIEPGAIDTPMWDKGLDQLVGLRSEVDSSRFEPYESHVRRAEATARSSVRHAIDPSRVAEAIVHALTARRPRHRYLVGVDARVAAYGLPLLPSRLRTALLRRI